MELRPNSFVNLTNGKKAKIIEEIGRGGQGIVYRIELDSKEWALKWYAYCPNDSLYKSIETMVNEGSPSESFIWPEYLSQKVNDYFGCVLKLLPKDYYEFSNFMLVKTQFNSFSSVIKAAMNICEGFAALHNRGYCHEDLNEDNFLINPLTGSVLFSDIAEIIKQGDPSKSMFKIRYAAPELVAYNNQPNIYSDRFSLAVTLFILIYGNHPFEGLKWCQCPCINETNETKIYGTELVFIFDEQDDSNRPVRGIHTNVIRRWPQMPKILNDAFIQEFSKDIWSHPVKRKNELEWISLLQRVIDMIVVSPISKEETFSEVI